MTRNTHTTLALVLGLWSGLILLPEQASCHGLETDVPVIVPPFVQAALDAAKKSGDVTPEGFYKMLVSRATDWAKAHGNRDLEKEITTLPVVGDSAQPGELGINARQQMTSLQLRILTILPKIDGRTYSISISTRPDNGEHKGQDAVEITDYNPKTGATQLYEVGPDSGVMQVRHDSSSPGAWCWSCHQNNEAILPVHLTDGFLGTSSSGRKYIQDLRGQLEAKCGTTPLPTASCKADDLTMLKRLSVLKPWPPSQNQGNYDAQRFLDLVNTDSYQRFSLRMRTNAQSRPYLPALAAAAYGCEPLLSYLPASSPIRDLSSEISKQRDGIIESVLSPAGGSLTKKYQQRTQLDHAIQTPAPSLGPMPTYGNDDYSRTFAQLRVQMGLDRTVIDDYFRRNPRKLTPRATDPAVLKAFGIDDPNSPPLPAKPDRTIDAAARLATVLEARGDVIPQLSELTLDPEIHDEAYPMAISLAGPSLPILRSSLLEEVRNLTPGGGATRSPPVTQAQACGEIARACSASGIGCSARPPATGLIVREEAPRAGEHRPDTGDDREHGQDPGRESGAPE